MVIKLTRVKLPNSRPIRHRNITKIAIINDSLILQRTTESGNKVVITYSNAHCFHIEGESRK